MAYPLVDLPNSIKVVMKNMNDLYPTRLRVRESLVGALGVELGRKLATSLVGEKNDEFMTSLACFWASNGLGGMRFSGFDSLRVRISDCYDCVGWEFAPRVLPCTFKRTLLETALGEGLGQKIRLVETTCCRTGGGSCVFDQKG